MNGYAPGEQAVDRDSTLQVIVEKAEKSDIPDIDKKK
jgi:hypothetical protein